MDQRALVFASAATAAFEPTLQDSAQIRRKIGRLKRVLDCFLFTVGDFETLCIQPLLELYRLAWIEPAYLLRLRRQLKASSLNDPDGILTKIGVDPDTSICYTLIEPVLTFFIDRQQWESITALSFGNDVLSAIGIQPVISCLPLLAIPTMDLLDLPHHAVFDLARLRQLAHGLRTLGILQSIQPQCWSREFQFAWESTSKRPDHGATPLANIYFDMLRHPSVPHQTFKERVPCVKHAAALNVPFQIFRKWLPGFPYLDGFVVDGPTHAQDVEVWIFDIDVCPDYW